jgi:hypothetical protein
VQLLVRLDLKVLRRAPAVVPSAVRHVIRIGVRPSLRDAVTFWVYDHQDAYAAGGQTFRRGLFGWERELLASGWFPREGTILIAAAGGGREVDGLVERGYRVVGFEPSDLVASAQVVGSRRDAVVCAGSYDDLIRAATRGDGPLAAICTERVDGVMLGWSSLSHVLDTWVRHQILCALRLLAPEAPVICSFLVRNNLRRYKGMPGRLANRLDILTDNANLVFDPRSGFSRLTDKAAVIDLANRAGYHVVSYSEEESPHALLVPQTTLFHDKVRPAAGN